MKLISADDLQTQSADIRKARKAATAQLEASYRELAAEYQQAVSDIDFDQRHQPQSAAEMTAQALSRGQTRSVSEQLNALIQSAVLRGESDVSVRVAAFDPVVQQADGSTAYLSEINQQLLDQAERDDQAYGFQVIHGSSVYGHFENQVAQMISQALADKLKQEIEAHPGYSVEIVRPELSDHDLSDWTVTISWKKAIS